MHRPYFAICQVASGLEAVHTIATDVSAPLGAYLTKRFGGRSCAHLCRLFRLSYSSDHRPAARSARAHQRSRINTPPEFGRLLFGQQHAQCRDTGRCKFGVLL